MPEIRSGPLAFTRRAPAEMVARAEAFADAMVARRTVRSFSSEPIPDGIIAAAVRAAASAPSGAHQQPWTFVVSATPASTRWCPT